MREVETETTAFPVRVLRSEYNLYCILTFTIRPSNNADNIYKEKQLKDIKILLNLSHLKK